MSAISRMVQRIYAFGAGLSLALVFVIVFVNSARRYASGRSFPWGEELPIYLTIYGVMFGIGLAYLQDRHIRFSILTDALSNRVKSRLFGAVDLVTIAVGMGLAWSGAVFVARRGAVEASGLIGTAKDMAVATGLPWAEWLGLMGTYQASIAFGGIVLALAGAIRFADRLKRP